MCALEYTKEISRRIWFLYSYFPGESISQTYHLRYIILLLLVFLFEKKTL